MTDLGFLGRKIFLDRYALHDIEKKTLKVGDTVIVITDEATGQREIGEVVQLTNKKAMVALEGSSKETPTWYLIEHIDKPLETEPREMISRVARDISKNEKDFEYWYNEFVDVMKDWSFVPGGRILAGAGAQGQLSFSNCYVLPCPKDSRQGIFERLSQMAEIMSRGGGVGITLSSLRPRHAFVKGVNGRSSGAVSWGGLYSTTTGLIEQSGSRRGALMLMLNDWHPDILEFVDSKREAGKIINANISVGISNEFMRAVEDNDEWNLVFPDTTFPRYNDEWDGDINAWLDKDYPVKIYKTIRAKDLWNKITESAWASAEPGIIFTGHANYMSNSWYYAKLIGSNPCSEQPLPAYGVCNLGAINLERMYHPVSGVDWEKLSKTVRTAIRFLDNVIDEGYYPFKENEEQQRSERRIGLSTMGLADLLIMNNIRYGSDESLEFIDELYGFIATAAYTTSIDIASEKGPFPKFEGSEFLMSGYMRAMPPVIRKGVERYGIRNVTLLTQAPTGTTGTMLGVATGLEPYFSFKWTRKSRLGKHEEYIKLAQDWLKYNPGQPLPDYFVTAQDILPEDHVRVQATIQRWVDSSISKTCNLPSYATVDDVKRIYELANELGVKGLTVYRDQSRSDQVLYNKEICPECNSESYVKESGCSTCKDCGYSKCDVVRVH